MTPVLTIDQIEDFLTREFPQIYAGGPILKCVNVAPATATLRFFPNESHLRPGGTVSGPALFALADVAAYVALLAHIGPVCLFLKNSSCAATHEERSFGQKEGFVAFCLGIVCPITQ